MLENGKCVYVQFNFSHIYFEIHIFTYDEDRQVSKDVGYIVKR